MSKKVITLPVSGSMVISHSKKLEWALRDFITATNGSYYDDEIANGIIALYLNLTIGFVLNRKFI